LSGKHLSGKVIVWEKSCPGPGNDLSGNVCLGKWLSAKCM